MSNKYYTTGEIFRLGLLKTADGKPYKHKASVSTRIAKSGYAVERPTRWGKSKTITAKQVEALNK